MMEEKTFSSFEVISENVIIKRIDKSLLSYGEIRIPNYLRDFFYFHEMEKHDRWDIRISYNQDDYYGVLYLDDYKKLRGKLRWGKDLTRELGNAAAKYIFDKYDGTESEEAVPLLRLKKLSRTEFVAEVLFPHEIMSCRKLGPFETPDESLENDPDTRLEVLKVHGLDCWICGFNYESSYGELGKGLIQVHYKGKEVKTEVNLVEDFIPLCGNCHAMVHMMEDSGAGIKDLKDYVRFRQEIRKTKK